MTEQLAESFRIKTFFNADCGISMSEKMKIYVSDFADLQNRFKTIVFSSGMWYNLYYYTYCLEVVYEFF